MKISMWMLENWFSDLRPVSNIIGGERIITGARILSWGDVPQKDYLYVSRTVGEEHRGQILLIHRNDVISLDSSDLETVFNRVLEALEYYNNLELQLIEYSRQPHSEQRILSACQHLVGPMFLLDPTHRMLASSTNVEVPGLWSDFGPDGTPPLDMLERMQSSVIISLFNDKHKRFLFLEPEAVPFCHGALTSCCDNQGKIAAQLIQSSRNPLTPFELQIGDILVACLEDMYQLPVSISVGAPPEQMLKAVLDEDSPEYSSEALRILMGWKRETRYVALVTLPESKLDEQMLAAYKHGVEQVMKGGISLIYDHAVLTLYPIAQEIPTEKLTDFLQELTARISVRTGISTVFTTLKDLRYYIRQCYDALSYCPGTQHAYFDTVALRVLAQATDPEYRLRCLHPCVPFLIQYDTANATAYAPTLREYLMTSRSCTQVAKRLFIHRNTVLYRMEQIEQLFPLDLDDPETRMYLMLSFLVIE